MKCISKARHFSFYCHEHKPIAALSRSTAMMQGSNLHCCAAADCQTPHQPLSGLGLQQHLPAPQVCCAVLESQSEILSPCLPVHLHFLPKGVMAHYRVVCSQVWLIDLQQGYNDSSRVDYPMDITYTGFLFFLAFEAVLAELCQL